jgi:hypothetical protein
LDGRSLNLSLGEIAGRSSEDIYEIFEAYLAAKSIHISVCAAKAKVVTNSPIANPDKSTKFRQRLPAGIALMGIVAC